MLTKTMLLFKESSNNAFTNEIYSHILSLYRKYNFSIKIIKAKALMNSPRTTENLPWILYPNVSEKDTLFLFFYELIPWEKTKEGLTNQFADQNLKIN